MCQPCLILGVDMLVYQIVYFKSICLEWCLTLPLVLKWFIFWNDFAFHVPFTFFLLLTWFLYGCDTDSDLILLFFFFFIFKAVF